MHGQESLYLLYYTLGAYSSPDLGFKRTRIGSRSRISHGNGSKNRGSVNPISRYRKNLNFPVSTLVVTDPEVLQNIFGWKRTLL